MTGRSSSPRAMRLRPTRFDGMPRWPARLLGVALLAVVLHGVAVGPGAPATVDTGADEGDAELYAAVVERVHAGEGYYDVAGSELRERGYATRPFFNWRLPLLANALARLPDPGWGRWLLAGLALATLVMWLRVLDDVLGFRAALAASLLLAGPLIAALAEQGFLFHEVWAGVLIALSLGAHGRGRWGWSVALGTLALCVRELALPYAGVMMGVALLERRPRDVAAWAAGIAGFAALLAVHGWIVQGHLGDVDVANQSWIQFGGWTFVLATARWNAFFFEAPQWVPALVLPLSLFGVAGWPGPLGTRLAGVLGAYVGAFLIAGRSDNAYWGLVCAPLLSLGLLYALPSLADLGRAALGRESSTRPTEPSEPAGARA